MEFIKEEIYDLSSPLWEAILDDPEYKELSQVEKNHIHSIIHNLKVTVH